MCKVSDADAAYVEYAYAEHHPDEFMRPPQAPRAISGVCQERLTASDYRELVGYVAPGESVESVGLPLFSAYPYRHNPDAFTDDAYRDLIG